MLKVRFKNSGDFEKTSKFLKGLQEKRFLKKLDVWGRQGVEALSSATPVDTGLTAASWDYEIHHSKGSVELVWTNSNTNKGVSIALLLQYGHGTGSGGYVQGRDYINPAMRPIFDKIAEEAWKEVTYE